MLNAASTAAATATGGLGAIATTAVFMLITTSANSNLFLARTDPGEKPEGYLFKKDGQLAGSSQLGAEARSSQLGAASSQLLGASRSSQLGASSSSQLGASRSSQLGASRSSQVGGSRSSQLGVSRSSQLGGAAGQGRHAAAENEQLLSSRRGRLEAGTELSGQDFSDNSISSIQTHHANGLDTGRSSQFSSSLPRGRGGLVGSGIGSLVKLKDSNNNLKWDYIVITEPQSKHVDYDVETKYNQKTVGSGLGPGLSSKKEDYDIETMYKKNVIGAGKGSLLAGRKGNNDYDIDTTYSKTLLNSQRHGNTNGGQTAQGDYNQQNTLENASSSQLISGVSTAGGQSLNPSPALGSHTNSSSNTLGESTLGAADSTASLSRHSGVTGVSADATASQLQQNGGSSGGADAFKPGEFEQLAKEGRASALSLKETPKGSWDYIVINNPSNAEAASITTSLVQERSGGLSNSPPGSNVNEATAITLQSQLPANSADASTTPVLNSEAHAQIPTAGPAVETSSSATSESQLGGMDNSSSHLVNPSENPLSSQGIPSAGLATTDQPVAVGNSLDNSTSDGTGLTNPVEPTTEHLDNLTTSAGIGEPDNSTDGVDLPLNNENTTEPINNSTSFGDDPAATGNSTQQSGGDTLTEPINDESSTDEGSNSPNMTTSAPLDQAGNSTDNEGSDIPVTELGNNRALNDDNTTVPDAENSNIVDETNPDSTSDSTSETEPILGEDEIEPSKNVSFVLSTEPPDGSLTFGNESNGDPNDSDITIRKKIKVNNETTVEINPNGTSTIKTVTTKMYPDGRNETNVDVKLTGTANADSADPASPTNSSDESSSLGDTESTPGDTESTPGDTGSTPGDTESTSGDTGSTPGDTESTPGDTESTSGDTESTPGDTESTPGDTESTPGDTGSTPGDTESTPDDLGSAPGDYTSEVGTDGGNDAGDTETKRTKVKKETITVQNSNGTLTIKTITTKTFPDGHNETTVDEKLSGSENGSDSESSDNNTETETGSSDDEEEVEKTEDEDPSEGNTTTDAKDQEEKPSDKEDGSDGDGKEDGAHGSDYSDDSTFPNAENPVKKEDDHHQIVFTAVLPPPGIKKN